MKNKIILIIITLIFVAGVGYYIWRDLNKNIEHSVSNISQNTNTCDESSTSSECVKDEQKISSEPANMPDLNRPINVLVDNLPEETVNRTKDKINEALKKLKENPDLFDEWLVLGVYYKLIGDYEGTKEVWEYAAIIRPKSSTPFNNLGDLYAYYLKDNKKAEENFLKALENGSAEIYIYRSTYEFYKFVMKDDKKAKEILQKGIKINPDTSQDLKYLLDNYDSLD